MVKGILIIAAIIIVLTLFAVFLHVAVAPLLKKRRNRK